MDGACKWPGVTSGAPESALVRTPIEINTVCIVSMMCVTLCVCSLMWNDTTYLPAPHLCPTSPLPAHNYLPTSSARAPSARPSYLPTSEAITE